MTTNINSKLMDAVRSFDYHAELLHPPVIGWSGYNFDIWKSYDSNSYLAFMMRIGDIWQ